MAYRPTPRERAYSSIVTRPPSSAMASIPCFYSRLEPEESLGLSEWSDKNRVLTSRSAAEAGPYRSARTPYLHAIMEDLSVESGVQRVVFKKCAQIGASELGNCWIGYLVDQAPGPILLVQPTVDLAK